MTVSSFLTKKFLYVSAIALLASTGLSACGGDSGSSANPVGVTPPPPPPPPTGVTFDVNGVTSKGLILNGNVSVADANDASKILSTGNTSAADGSYTVNIPDTANFEGPFIKVTVTGGNNALMICDAGDGCITNAGDTVSFGETFEILENVSLSAIVPTPADEGASVVNLTIFTDLAAALTENAAGDVTEAELLKANAQVSNLFGLTIDNPSQLAALDISNAAAEGGDIVALRAAILSGGVLSAGLENGPNLGVALEMLRADFAANDGQLVINEDLDDLAFITMEDILDGAVGVSSFVAIEGQKAGSAKAKILGESLSAQRAEAGVRTDANVAPSNDAIDLDKAKSFVADLQLVVAAVQDEENEDNFIDFADRVDEAAQALEGDAESAVETALEAVDAIGRAYDAYQDDNALRQISANGFDVTITPAGDDVALSIAEQVVDGNTVVMSVSGDIDIVEETTSTQEGEGNIGSSSSETIITIGGEAELNGYVENDALRLEVLSGEVNIKDGFISQTENNAFDYSSTETGDNSNYSGDQSTIVMAELVEGRLEVAATQKKENGLAFEGFASAKLVAPKFEQGEFYISRYEYEYDINDYTTAYNVSGSNRGASLSAAEFGFSGRLSEGGQFVDLTFALQAEADNLSAVDEATPQITSRYEIENNELTFIGTTSDNTLSFVTYQEAQDEIATFTGEVLELSVGTVYRNEDGEGLRALVNISNPDAPVFKINRVDRETGEITFNYFLQAEAIEPLFGPPSEGFVDNPPTDIVDFYNEGFVVERTPIIICSGDPGNPFLRTERFVIPGTAGFTGLPLKDNSFTPYCEGGSNQFANLSTDNMVTLDENAEVSAVVTASIAQNIAGIDPDDPLVTATLYGPVSYANEELAGNLTVELEFAGRTFMSDARGLDVFDDLSEPVTITNQDGVEMYIFENTEGNAEGRVSINGENQGVISEENGIILVTYTDDTFVSIK